MRRMPASKKANVQPRGPIGPARRVARLRQRELSRFFIRCTRTWLPRCFTIDILTPELGRTRFYWSRAVPAVPRERWTLVSAKRVWHPGTKGDGFWKMYFKAQRVLRAELEAMAARVWVKSSGNEIDTSKELSLMPTSIRQRIPRPRDNAGTVVGFALHLLH